MTRDFGAATARKNCNQRFCRIEAVPHEERFAALRGSHVANQRVSDEFHRHACVAKKLFLEWKDTQRQRETAAHDAYSPGPPGPELRTDVVNISDTERFQFPRKSQVEAGKVSENCELRLSRFSRIYKSVHRANQLGKVSKDLGHF
jgi:hypothetical protein